MTFNAPKPLHSKHCLNLVVYSLLAALVVAAFAMAMMT